jgi:hypothetical protein
VNGFALGPCAVAAVHTGHAVWHSDRCRRLVSLCIRSSKQAFRNVSRLLVQRAALGSVLRKLHPWFCVLYQRAQQAASKDLLTQPLLPDCQLNALTT